MKIDVTLAGPLTARSEVAEIAGPDFGGRRSSVAFALLVLAGDQQVSRDRLVDVLWPDGPPASWVPGVRSVMTKVRAAFARVLPDAGDVIVHAGDGYRLALPPGTALDVDVRHAFQALETALVALDEGSAPESARLASDARVVFSRQFLPGEDGPWVGEIRHDLHVARVRALEVLARARLGLEQPALAAAAAAEAVRLEPYQESAHRLLIAAHANGGNRGEALRAYERCRRLLAEELGVDPSPETEALYLTLLGDEPEPRARIVVPGEWRMVGRDEHLSVVEHLLDGAVSGRGAVALITGDAGMGKTRLARELGVRASARGASVLWGTCREPEWAAPNAALADLVPDLAKVAAQELVDRLERRLSGGDAPIPDSDRLAVREDLRRAVLGATIDTPILLVVDDLQWADDGTLAALRHLTPSVPTARLLVVMTKRDDAPDEYGAVETALTAMARTPGITRVPLDALDVRAVAELVESVATGAPEWLGRAVATETAGNPFFVQATVAHLVESGTLVDVVAGTSEPDEVLRDVPVAVSDVISRQLDGLTDTCRKLLRMAAMFEGPFLFGDAARAADLDESVGLDALDEALAARVLVDASAADSYEFSHAIVRHTIPSSLSASRRSRMHRRVAEAIEERAAGRPTISDACELAAQYHGSASLPGAERGVEHAIRAAEHAEATGAFDTAASLLRIALDLMRDDDPNRRPLAGRIGLVLLRATRYEDGAALVMEAADALADEGDERGAAALLADAGWAAEMAGGSTTAFALAAAGLPLAGGEHDHVWARLTILDLRRREADEPQGRGLPIHTPERRAAARLLREDARFRGALAWAVWDSRAEILERGSDDMHALTYWAGQYREALPLWQRAAAAAEPRGQVSESVNSWAGAARCAIALGHLGDAEEMIEHARDLARRIDLRGSFALHLAVARDDLAHARDSGYDELWHGSHLQAAGLSDKAQRWAEAAWFALCARLLAFEERRDDAKTVLEGVAEVLPLAPVWAVGTNRFVGDAAAAIWMLGDRTHLPVIAGAVRTKLVEPDFRCPMTEPRHAMGRVLGVAGKTDDAREWFEAARQVTEEDGLGPMRAIVDHDEALLLVRAGDVLEARALAKASAERCADLGMGGWLMRAERLAAG